MPMNKDVLGLALYNVRKSYSDKTINQLIDEFGSLEAARLAQAKEEAEQIINHITNEAAGIYQSGSLVAGANPVTRVGNSITVKIS